MYSGGILKNMDTTDYIPPGEKEEQNGISLRRMTKSEYPKAYLWYKDYSENDLHVPCDIVFGDFVEWMDGDGTTPYFIQKDGKSVGFVITEYVPRFSAWYIAEICVQKEYRNKKIGSTAFEMLLTKFDPVDVFWFTLVTNPRATKLWAQVARDCGYRQKEPCPIPKPDDNVLVHYFTKP